MNLGFLDNEDQLIKSSSIDKIRHIPAKIIQGRYDMICPVETAWELSKNWQEAELIIAPSSGHSAFEKEITHYLISATNEFSRNV
jgi:proline iminopeptidase